MSMKTIKIILLLLNTLSLLYANDFNEDQAMGLKRVPFQSEELSR